MNSKKRNLKEIIKRRIAGFLAVLMAVMMLPDTTLMALAASNNSSAYESQDFSNYPEPGDISTNVINMNEDIDDTNDEDVDNENDGLLNEGISGAGDDNPDIEDVDIDSNNELTDEDVTDEDVTDEDENTLSDSTVSDNDADITISSNEAVYGEAHVYYELYKNDSWITSVSDLASVIHSYEEAAQDFDSDTDYTIKILADGDGRVYLSTYDYESADIFPESFSYDNNCKIVLDDSVRFLTFVDGNNSIDFTIPDYRLFEFDNIDTVVEFETNVNIYFIADPNVNEGKYFFDLESESINSGHLSLFNCTNTCINLKKIMANPVGENTLSLIGMGDAAKRTYLSGKTDYSLQDSEVPDFILTDKYFAPNRPRKINIEMKDCCLDFAVPSFSERIDTDVLHMEDVKFVLQNNATIQPHYDDLINSYDEVLLNIQRADSNTEGTFACIDFSYMEECTPVIYFGSTFNEKAENIKILNNNFTLYIYKKYQEVNIKNYLKNILIIIKNYN